MNLRVRLGAILLLALGLFAGGIAAAGAQEASPVAGTGVLTVASYVGEVDEPVLYILDEVAASDTVEGVTITPDDRDFVLYQAGEEAPVASFSTVGGYAVVTGLAAGDYILFDVASETFFSGITIADDATTSVSAIFPVVSAATPVATTTATSAPVVPGAPTPAVVALPNTGQGSGSGTSTSIVLLFGAMSLVAVAAGFAWRQRRTN
jgi:hypothetical protein